MTAPVINPIVLFATYSAFGNSVKMALYRALGSLLVATVLGIFLGFIQTDSIQKEHRKAVHEHDFRDLSKGQSSFKSWYKPLMNSLIRDVTWYLVASLPASSKSMSQHGSSLRSARHQLLLFSFSCSCPFSSHFVAGGRLCWILSSDEFWSSAGSCLLVIGPMLDVKISS